MPSKYSVVDVIATIAGKHLPEMTLDTKTISDADAITVLAWCEDWEQEEVYDTAYKTSNIEKIQTWDQWIKSPIDLPGPARFVLVRGLERHIKLGNIKHLQDYGRVYHFLSWTGVRIGWTAILALFYWLYLSFV